MLKKRQVVMLPTKPNDKPTVDLVKCIKSFEHYLDGVLMDQDTQGILSVGVSSQMDVEFYEAQHLYFTAQDEEIKEGDWFIVISKGLTTYNTIGQFTGPNKRHSQDNIQKIVATTNPDLLRGAVLENTVTGKKSVKMAEIPENFIEEFVKAQGNIKEVMLEYHDDWIPGVMKSPEGLKLSIDSTVIIHPVVEKTYTRQELFDALLGYHKHCNGNHISWAEIKEAELWFDTNYPQ